MNIELSAEGQKVVSELPPAQTDLRAAETALEAIGQEIKGLDRKAEKLEQEHAKDLEALETDRTKSILINYDPYLQSVMAFALGNKDRLLPEDPDLEACQRIAELDAKLKNSAGQPVVVINPGKGWIDFGTLPAADPERRIESKGLVFDDDPHTHSNPRIEVPVHNVLALNPDTGKYPDRSLDSDGELFAREQGFNAMHRPIIDPAATRAVLPGETAEDYADDGQETTLILIGHTHLRNILNDILGFEPGEDRHEGHTNFFRIDSAVKELREHGTIFYEPDMIDGYLLFRISVLEQEMQEDGLPPEKDEYRKQVLEGLWSKYNELLETGWLKR